MDDWRSWVPARLEHNDFFEWFSDRKDRKGEHGAHVPTSRGTSLLASLLGKFDAVVPELATFFAQYEQAGRISEMNTAKAQAINYLVKLWPIGLTRASLNGLFGERGLLPAEHGLRPSKDPIQLVNKVDQRGIQDLRENLFDASGTKHVVYRIPVPVKFTSVRIGVRSRHVPLDKDRMVEDVKDWLRREFLDVPADRWQVGHRNPAKSDSDPKNVVMQPPNYNQPRRNRFIFDERGFVVFPTVDEFCKRLRHYVASADDARRMISALQKAFPSATEPG
jgi:hypothetical protein